jgi:hypothetical protein
VHEQLWSIDRALFHARSQPQAADRADALRSIAGSVSANQRETILAEALAAARAVSDSGVRAAALIRLRSEFPAAEQERLLPEALANARAVDYPLGRVDELATIGRELGDHQRDELFLEALDALRSVDEEAERQGALRDLAPLYPPGAFSEALALALTTTALLGSTLKALAPAAASADDSGFLLAVEKLDWERDQLCCLAAQAQFLTPALVDLAISDYEAAFDEPESRQALAQIVEGIPKDTHTERTARTRMRAP